MSVTVHAFNKEFLLEKLKTTDPYVISYIDACHNSLEIAKQTNDKAIKKIKELSALQGKEKS